MGFKVSVIMVFTIIILFSSCVQAEESFTEHNIYFELSVDGFFGLENHGPSGFGEFRDDLEESGYYVRDNFLESNDLGSISKTALGSSDIYVLINLKRSISTDEQEALGEYVQEGGNIIVICDSPESVPYTNQVLQQFNLSFEQRVILCPKIILNNRTFHFDYAIPLNESLSDKSASSISEGRDSTRIDATYEPDKSQSNNYETSPIFISKPVEEGKVVAIGTKEFLKNDRYAQDKEIWYHVQDILSKDMVSSELILTPFELRIPIDDTEFADTTFVVNYQLRSINKSTGSEELIKNVTLSLEYNPSMTVDNLSQNRLIELLN